MKNLLIVPLLGLMVLGNFSSSAVLAAGLNERISLIRAGSYQMAIDKNLPSLANPQNVLAGTTALVGRIKVNAKNEDALLVDLVLANAGTAKNNTLATLYLYGSANLSGSPLGSADLESNQKANFRNLNITIPKTGDTYLYIAGLIKSIDYSSTPSADATAEAAKNIKIYIPTDKFGYKTKVVGKESGKILKNNFNSNLKTSTSTVMGAVVSALTTSFTDKTLVNGIKDIFSFKVTAPASTNVDYNGDPLAVKLGTVTFTIATSGVNISALKIERTSGSGEKTVSPVITTGGTFTIDFPTTFGTDSDLKVKPGETAEYTIRATVAGTDGTGDSISVSMESVNTLTSYTHNTGVAGADAADTAAVYPLIPGTTFVRGGSLSN